MAQQNITIIINSPPSSEVTFTPAQPSFVAPVPAGTVLGVLSVAPAAWSGALALGGPDVAKVVLNGTQIAAAVELMAGTLSLTATSSP